MNIVKVAVRGGTFTSQISKIYLIFVAIGTIIKPISRVDKTIDNLLNFSVSEISSFAYAFIIAGLNAVKILAEKEFTVEDIVVAIPTAALKVIPKKIFMQ